MRCRINAQRALARADPDGLLQARRNVFSERSSNLATFFKVERARGQSAFLEVFCGIGRLHGGGHVRRQFPSGLLREQVNQPKNSGVDLRFGRYRGGGKGRSTHL